MIHATNITNKHYCCCCCCAAAVVTLPLKQNMIAYIRPSSFNYCGMRPLKHHLHAALGPGDGRGGEKERERVAWREMGGGKRRRRRRRRCTDVTEYAVVVD